MRITQRIKQTKTTLKKSFHVNIKIQNTLLIATKQYN